ncbi:hypothetical protein OB905_04750 [Halobacteria archaeon AArc-dxtr1]|nr:hypothetical protein [Halobacteria archaeon AArc-dxtr1]
MSLLESMFGAIGGDGEAGTAKFSGDRYDVTYTVSDESHDVAYAIPVSEPEIAALGALLRAEREAPYVEDGDESLAEALESVLDTDSVDVEAWTERMAAPRRAVEPVVETWERLATAHSVDGTESDDGTSVGDAPDSASADLIVYLPVGAESTLASFFDLCRRRDERDSDPFTLPPEIDAAAAMLGRVRDATGRSENRVVVNTRHLPEIEG